jgi:hypothetical protein
MMEKADFFGCLDATMYDHPLARAMIATNAGLQTAKATFRGRKLGVYIMVQALSHGQECGREQVHDQNQTRQKYGCAIECNL